MKFGCNCYYIIIYKFFKIKTALASATSLLTKQLEKNFVPIYSRGTYSCIDNFHTINLLKISYHFASLSVKRLTSRRFMTSVSSYW